MSILQREFTAFELLVLLLYSSYDRSIISSVVCFSSRSSYTRRKHTNNSVVSARTIPSPWL